MSRTATIADAAATAIANTINSEEDIGKAITRFKKYGEIGGLIIIKNKRIGLWGNYSWFPLSRKTISSMINIVFRFF